jgi:hypothetical protein
MKVEKDIQCLKIIEKSSLCKIELLFGESGAGDKNTLNWYCGHIICETTFLNLRNWVNESTLDDLLSNNNWRENPVKGRFIDVQRVNKMQDIIKKCSDKYFQYIPPITIRQIVQDDIKESEINYDDFSFWLEDGLHRSIALGDLLTRDKIKFYSIPIYYGTKLSLENNKVYTLKELSGNNSH